MWQGSPMVVSTHSGLNLLHQPFSGTAANISMNSGLVVVGAPISTPPGNLYFAGLVSVAKGKPSPYYGDPFSSIYLPVFDSFASDRKAVASMITQIFWVTYFENILPPTDNGITVILKSCSGAHTFEIHGKSVAYIGSGDTHDSKFDYEMRKTNFQLVDSIPDSTKEGLKFDKEFCPVEIEVYPTTVRCVALRQSQ
jgi:hypothetical protein